jgi:uncharacterized protein YybS (DUF2232 family)
VRGSIGRDLLAGTLATIGFYLFSIFLPVFGILAVIFVPFPCLYVRATRGRVPAIVLLGIASIILCIFLGRLSSEKYFLFFIQLAITGLIIGEFWEQRLSIEKSMSYSVGTAIATSIVFFLLYGLIVQKSPLEFLKEDLLQEVERSVEIYITLGVKIGERQDIKVLAERMVNAFIRVLPAMMVIGFSVLAWSNLMVLRLVATRRELNAPPWGELNNWQAPEKLVWGLVVSGFAAMTPFTAFKWAGINGIIVLAMVYFFQGLAIVSFYCVQKMIPRPLRVIIYSIICIQQLLGIMVAATGLFDTWFDFRKLHKKAPVS